MWFELKPADVAWIVDAPYRFDTAAVIDAPCERIFEAFEDPARMAEFISGFRRCEWQSDGPHGVGAIRQLDLMGLSFREHFIAWQPGRRFCFAIDAMTLPLMRRMVEDVQIDRIDDSKSRLVWSVYYQPTLLTALVHPFARFGFELGYRRSVNRLASYLTATRPIAQPAPAPRSGRRVRVN